MNRFHLVATIGCGTTVPVSNSELKFFNCAYFVGSDDLGYSAFTVFLLADKFLQ